MLMVKRTSIKLFGNKFVRTVGMKSKRKNISIIDFTEVFMVDRALNVVELLKTKLKVEGGEVSPILGQLKNSLLKTAIDFGNFTPWQMCTPKK